eukprot:1350776-Pyramimonas_sp.AAC.1
MGVNDLSVDDTKWPITQMGMLMVQWRCGPYDCQPAREGGKCRATLRARIGYHMQRSRAPLSWGSSFGSGVPAASFHGSK